MIENIVGIVPDFDAIKVSEKKLTIVITQQEVATSAIAKGVRFVSKQEPISENDFVLISYTSAEGAKQLQIVAGSDKELVLQKDIQGKCAGQTGKCEINGEIVEYVIESVKGKQTPEFTDEFISEVYGPQLTSKQEYCEKYINDNKDNKKEMIVNQMTFPCLMQLEKTIHTDGQLAQIFLEESKQQLLKQFGSEEALFAFMKDAAGLKENQTIEDAYKLLYEECVKREHYLYLGKGLAEKNQELFSMEKYEETLKQQAEEQQITIDEVKEKNPYDKAELVYYEEYIFVHLQQYIGSKVIIKLED